LDQFLGTTEGELNEWLRRTLQRNIIDEVRRATAKKRDFGREQAGRGPDESGSSPIEQLPDDERGPGSRLILLEDSDRLRKALHQILPDQQQAIRLVYIEHLSLPEAAARLGRSPGAVAKLLKRGIESLRALLKEMPDPQAE
jgi:RNA polymerase sigma-70 factor, ECF subfamily